MIFDILVAITTIIILFHEVDKTNDISIQRQLTLNTYFSYYHQKPTQLSKICTLVATSPTWITNDKSLLEDSIFNWYLPGLILASLLLSECPRSLLLYLETYLTYEREQREKVLGVCPSLDSITFYYTFVWWKN